MKKLLGIAVFLPLSGVIALSSAGAASALNCGHNGAAATTGKSIPVCAPDKTNSLVSAGNKGVSEVSKAATTATKEADKGIAHVPSKVSSLSIPVLKDLEPDLKDSDRSPSPAVPLPAVKPIIPVVNSVTKERAATPAPSIKADKKVKATVVKTAPSAARSVVKEETVAVAPKVNQASLTVPVSASASAGPSPAATVASAPEAPVAKAASVPASKQGFGFFGIEGVLGAQSFSPGAFVVSLLTGALAVTAGILYWGRKFNKEPDAA